MSSSRPVTAVIVGAGNRSLIYASYSKTHPDELKIVGVVEPNEVRRKEAAKAYDIPDDRCFTSVEELVSHPKMADAAINGTMDWLHAATSVPLLEAGYDMLLEKPIGINLEEVEKIWSAANRYGRKVLICHVLRYAPFYVEIKKRIAAGDIGEIISLETAEYVGYDLMSAAFIRGKWSRKDWAGSDMLMSKCCHDLDLITWMMSGNVPRRVSSFGGLMYFRPEKAPQGSGTRCLLDCSIEPDCPYSAKRLYLQNNYWDMYTFPDLYDIGGGTIKQKIEALNTINPHGLCAWRAGNDVVDHQTVIIEFESGATVTHNMIGGATRTNRVVHAIGTKGELEGSFNDFKLTLRRFNKDIDTPVTEEAVEIPTVADDVHNGGDTGLVRDFIRVMRGETPSISSTILSDSIYGHLIGFTADRARLGRRIEEIESL